MLFAINRSGGRYDLTITDNDSKVHTFDLAPMTRIERARVREMVVNQWALDHGFPPPYSL